MTSSSAKHTRNKQLIGSCLIKTCLEFMINWLTNTHPNRDLHSWKFTTTNRERCFHFYSCIQEAYEFPIKTWGKKSPSPKEQASYDQSHDQNPSVSYDQSHDQNHSNIMWTEQNNNKQKNRHSHNAPTMYSPYLKCTCQSESGMWWFLGEFCGEHAAVPEPAAGHCCTPVTPNFAENMKIKRVYICKEHTLPEHSHSLCGNSHWPKINIS